MTSRTLPYLSRTHSRSSSWSDWLRGLVFPLWVRWFGAIMCFVGGLAFVGCGHSLLAQGSPYLQTVFYSGVTLVNGLPAVAFATGWPWIRPTLVNLAIPLGLVAMCASALA